MALGIAAVLLSTTVTISAYAEPEKKTVGKNETSSDTAAAAVDAGGTLKDETVYVIAGADGSVEKIIVSDWLQDALGEDLYYQETAGKELPIDLSVTYTLDGKEISPQELAGKSGHLVMRLDYSNRQYEEKEIDGKLQKIYVPFVAVTGMLLDNEVFHNVETVNGRLINDGDRSVVIGLALPGFQENLGISREELEIPDSILVEADVENFSLATTMTLVTNSLFKELDPDQPEALGKLSGSIGELTDAMAQLMDGAGQLSNGLNTLAEKSGELISGVGSLVTGAAQLKAGAAALASGAGDLAAGAGTLQTGAGEVQSGAGTLQAGVGEVQNGAGALQAGIGRLQAGADALQAGVSELSGGADALVSGADSLESGLAALTAKNDALQAGAGQVFDSLLQTATAQLQAAGVPLQTALTPENYQGVLTSVIESLNGAGAASQAESVAALKAQLDSYSQFYLGLKEYTGGVSAAAAGAENLTVGANALKNGVNQVSEGSAALWAGTKEVQAGADSLKAGTDSLKAGADSLKAGTDKLKAGADSIKTGADSLKSGADDLYAGASQLSSGIGALENGSGALAEGVNRLRDGAEQLSDGLNTFNEEAIQKLVDLIERDGEALMERYRATIQVSQNYHSFSGLDQGAEEPVKFIYRTDEIETEKSDN